MVGRATHLALGLTVVGVLAGCSNLETSYDYDPNVDFESLKTYSWMPVRASRLTQFELDRVTNAVENALIERGFQRTADADFLLKVFVGRGNTLGTGYGWSVDTRVYEEGTLVIDMIDPVTSKLMWRGTAVKPLEENPTPETQTRNIAEAVDAVLRNFPPRN